MGLGIEGKEMMTDFYLVMTEDAVASYGQDEYEFIKFEEAGIARIFTSEDAAVAVAQDPRTSPYRTEPYEQDLCSSIRRVYKLQLHQVYATSEHPEAAKARHRESALAKLTEAEISALGVKR